MSDIIKKDDTGIVSLLHGKGGLDIPKPFVKDTFLLETHIAGTTHIEGIKELEPFLTEETRLSFFRETDNAYDSRAIAIKTADGVKIGYVPQEKNEIISRLMDAGKLIYGKISEKEFVGNWLKITVEVFLND
jgi:hypothetical protein